MKYGIELTSGCFSKHIVPCISDGNVHLICNAILIVMISRYDVDDSICHSIVTWTRHIKVHLIMNLRLTAFANVYANPIAFCYFSINIMNKFGFRKSCEVRVVR